MAARSAPPAMSLRLLGPPALVGPEGVRPFSAERPFLLLAILACRRDWVRRDELADLLYPGRDLESARSNLRKVLFLARKVDGAGAIEQQGDLLRWTPDSDLQRFEAACDAQHHGDAIAAYGGPLLLGLDGAWPAGAADWLHAERQRLQSRWHEACTRRLAQLVDEPAAARELAQAMLRHDPLDDLALQALGRAQQALGAADAALQAIAGYADRLSDAGLAPSAAVAQLQRDLREAAAPAPAAVAALVGRRHELARVRERLARADCRVLTLLGPPGVGKSALARSAAAALGGAWVPLEDLQAADQVPGRIAQRLNLAIDGRAAPWHALAQALASRADLLVLDNTEHLPLAEGLQHVLDGAPAVRLLAAARAPLGLAAEWRMPLDGLPLPDADETDPDVLRANDAVHLFEQRARPLAPAFDLAAEAADVVRLVHEVDGLPLAIELLAAWRRLMPVREILAKLAASLDVLDGSAPNERSVRASFARAWQQLGPTEQRVLAQLALLPGPVGREMARQVLQAPLPALAVLVDRSLLRAEGDGRFALHPLIRRCAEPLAADADAVRARHAQHVAAHHLRSAEQTAAEIAHVRAAWRWGVAQRDAAMVGAMVEPYVRHLVRRAEWQAGAADLQAALDALAPPLAAGGPLPPAGPGRECARAVARVHNGLALLCYSLGRLDASLEHAGAAGALAERLGEPRIQATAQVRAGAVHWQRGHYDAAHASFTRAKALADAHDAGSGDAHSGWLALVAKARGHYAEAVSVYETMLARHRAAGRLPEHLYVMNNLGNLLRLLGRHADALAVLHEAREVGRRHGQLDDEPFLLTNIALTHETAGELETALDWAERAVDAGREHGEPMIEAAARLARARLAAVLGRTVPAPLHDVLDALAIAGRLNSPPLRVQCLGSAGVVVAHARARETGLAMILWAQAQPEIAPPEREDLQRHVDRLAPGADALAAARAALPAGTPFDEVLARLPVAARP